MAAFAEINRITNNTRYTTNFKITLKTSLQLLRHSLILFMYTFIILIKFLLI